MLVGIVKKNAIMQIDFALEAERTHGKTPAEAIYEGCVIRFRPIMMTTMAALLGAAADRARARRRRGKRGGPLGLAVVGGLLVSQLITAVSDAGHLHLHGEAGAGREKFLRSPGPPFRPRHTNLTRRQYSTSPVGVPSRPLQLAELALGVGHGLLPRRPSGGRRSVCCRGRTAARRPA